MIPYLDIMTNCCGCDNCIIVCPENAIIVKDGQYIVDQWRCSLCMLCAQACPDEVIKLKERDDNI